MVNLNHKRAASMLALGSVLSASTIAWADEVLITATRFEQSLTEVNGDVSVVTAEQIQQSGANNLSEVLDAIPGLQLTSNGGPRQNSSIFIRGHQAKHTLIMIDGVRVGAFDGFTNVQIQNLSVEQIERIEVLKGPASALYGSDAIGGVIQIVSKQGEGGALSLSAGRYGQAAGTLSQGFKFGQTDLSLSAGYEESDGFSALKGTRERDGHENTHANLSLRHRWSDRLTTGLRGFWSDADVEFDIPGFGSFPATEDNVISRTEIYGLVADFGLQWSDQHETRFSAGRNAEDRESDSGFVSLNRYVQTQLQAEHRVNLGQGQLLLGAAHLKQEFDSNGQDTSAAGLEQTIANSVTAAWFAQMGRFSYQASARQDFYSDVSDKATGMLSAGWQATPSVKLGGSFGTGFRRPSASEIIGFGPNSFNAGLRPEESLNTELYVAGNWANAQWRVTAYRNEIDDLLVFDNNTFGYRNEPDESTFKGLSASVSGQLAGTDLSAVLDLTQAENSAGQKLGRVAEEKLVLTASRQFGPWTPWAQLSLVGDRPDQTPSQFNPQPRELGGYGLLNVNLAYQIAPASRINLRINNVLDKDYEIASGYNVPKMDWLLSFRQQF